MSARADWDEKAPEDVSELAGDSTASTVRTMVTDEMRRQAKKVLPNRELIDFCMDVLARIKGL